MPRRFRSLCLLALLPLLAAATPPTDLTTTPLFAAGDHGYSGFRIPALAVTPGGVVLVAAEARRDNLSDWGHIDLVSRRSTDGGRTWSDLNFLIRQDDLPAEVSAAFSAPEPDAPAKPLTIGNATWVVDTERGKTLLLFCVDYQRCFLLESDDDGATFSAPRDITAAFATFRTRDGYYWKVLATGPGHGIQLTSGRLVVPLWLSDSSGRNPHHPSVCATICSDDGGRTWQAGEIIASEQRDGLLDPSETVVVEVAPGRVMANIRSESIAQRRAAAFSADGASGWSKPVFQEEILEPVCMGSLTRLPDGRLVFANPASLDPRPATPQRIHRLRHRVAVRTSMDGGRSWSEPLVIVPGRGAYSDLAVAPDGDLLCLVENGDTSPYERLSLVRIPVSLLP